MTVVSTLNEIASLAMQLCEEWEAEGNRHASTIPSPWPFSDDKSGGLSIDEWAFQVRGLAEAYAEQPVKMETKYVHQFRTVSGWDTVTEDDDVTPVTWTDKAEADREMDTFFQEIEAAVARGDMNDHDRADWRVVELEENQSAR
jgi:hypothetical protein